MQPLVERSSPRRRTPPPDRTAGSSRTASRWRRVVGPVVLSTLTHAVAIGVLALTFVAGVERKRLAISLDIASAPALEECTPIEIAADDPLVADSSTAASEAPAEPLPAFEPGAVLPDAGVEPALAEICSAADISVESASPSALEGLPLDGMLSEIETGAGHDGGGGERDAGVPPGRLAGTFFGRTGQGRSVCFLCDNSNSHSNGGFHVVLEEVAKAVEGLPADHSFFVVFFSDAAYPLFHPAPADTLVPATADNKRRLRSWLATVEMCRGGQGIHDAVRLAGGLGPDVLYLLSDGQFSAGVVDSLAAADFGEAVVHTFGIQQTVVDRRTGLVDPEKLQDQHAWNRNLISIATAHRGGFTPVNISPLAGTLERLRPIPRNRFRGAVWGLRL